MDDGSRKEELAKILTEYGRSLKDSRIKKEELQRDRAFSDSARSRLRAAGIIFVLFLVCVLLAVAAGASGLFGARSLWVAGDYAESDYLLSACVGNLWNIRKAIDIFYANHGVEPESLEQLYEARLLPRNLVCPASRKPYILIEREGSAVCVCPDAQSHGVGALGMAVSQGVPEVSR